MGSVTISSKCVVCKVRIPAPNTQFCSTLCAIADYYKVRISQGYTVKDITQSIYRHMMNNEIIDENDI